MPEHTIAENLTRLQNATTAIASAITEMGGIINQGDGLEDFPNAIRTIPVPISTKVYGFFIDSSESNSDDAVTYIEDAVGMTPAAMGETTFSYGDWENAFFMPKPCMLKSNGVVDYYLNPNDYTKKVDGTPSDIADTNYDGNAMMEFPKIWYKFVGGTNTGDGYFYVSNTKIDNDYHCWCNIDANNNEIEHFYMAIYNSTGTSKLRSLSGVTLDSNSGNGNTTGIQEINRATANNPSEKQLWYIEQWCDRLLVNALLILMSKSLNSQGKFGRGITTGNATAKESYITGSLNNKGLFYGDISGDTTAVKVFGIENWWGLQNRRVAGCVTENKSLKIKLTWGTADGSTTIGYNNDGTGYILDDSIPSSSYYVVKMLYNEYGFMTKSVNQYASGGYYTDGFETSTNNGYLLAGGNSTLGQKCGAFYFDFSINNSGYGWSVSTSLSCKPLATI